MLALYAGALAFGLLLIGASALGVGDGHGHGDAGSHGHGDADHGGFLTNLLSLRFWTFALGAFGMTGTLLTLLKVTPAVAAAAAGALGVAVGGLTSAAFNALRRASAASPVAAENLLGAEAEVVLALRPGRLGKIRLHLSGQDTELVARAGEEDDLAAASRVVVVRFAEGVAEVRPAPWKEEP